ncbi:MAG: mandelate racemase/muconate lactonizing enzyme family protein, partial [Gammaproteobacteria bacterium]|nr:mandelate racemase/muconate lactonizing enzyme family protein [Gammaproteobacteria bacterium]
ELLNIARAAGERSVSVSRHNACGPVATAASLAVCAAADNVESLELQWGEVDWRSSLIDPPEQVSDGALAVSDRPGFGVELRV